MPSLGNGGIGSKDSFLCNDQNCGKESTGWMEWQVVSCMCLVELGLEKPLLVFLLGSVAVASAFAQL